MKYESKYQDIYNSFRKITDFNIACRHLKGTKKTNRYEPYIQNIKRI